MTLAERLATPISGNVNNRILILDVERVAGITQQHWWERRDLQKRYIHHETVTREPRTTIVCAKWYDSPDIIRLTEWDKGGRARFLKNVHALMASADIIVGHNVMNADIPWLEGDLYFPRIGHKHVPNLPPLPPFKTVDTLRVARQFKSGVAFKSLNALCEILGIPAKTDVYDRGAMDRAVDGSVEDRERLTEYCAGDVIAPKVSTTGCDPTSKTIRHFSSTARTSSPYATGADPKPKTPHAGTSPTSSPTACANARTATGTRDSASTPNACH